MKLFTIGLLTIGLMFSSLTTANAQATGETIKCPNCVARKDAKMQNYFRITASQNTDVAVKVIDKKTNRCIRTAFVNEGDTYDIQNIPDGKYYCKIAYGKEWEFNGASKCKGEFTKYPLYKKTKQVFDFAPKMKKGKIEGYPCFSLDLDMTVEESEGEGGGTTETITASEFNR